MEENSKNNETAQLGIGAVICRLSSVYLIEPLEFTGDPIYYKMNGMYGYLMPSGNKVLWFYSDADGGLFYDELDGWSVLNGI
jgi:hypothetical protein